MTCPGGNKCSCSYTTRDVSPVGEHAYSGLLPDFAWWRKAIAQQFEGAVAEEHVHLNRRNIQFVEGHVCFPDGMKMWLPMMANALEVKPYARTWRERVMEFRQGWEPGQRRDLAERQLPG